MYQFATQMFQRSLLRSFLLSARQVMQGINGQQNREMLRCLQGRMMTQDEPLLCPKCCMCVSLLAPEKNSKLFSSEKCLCNCYSKWKKSHHGFRNKTVNFQFLPALAFEKGSGLLGEQGARLLWFLAVAAIMLIFPSSNPVPRESRWSRWDPPWSMTGSNKYTTEMQIVCGFFPCGSLLAFLSSPLPLTPRTAPEGWVLLCSNEWDRGVSLMCSWLSS